MDWPLKHPITPSASNKAAVSAGVGDNGSSSVSALVSVIWDKSLAYPAAEDYFSPSEAFPEYNLGHQSRSPNRVYGAVRSCLANAGLDAENFGTAAWNPLGRYVQPGNKVFVLCNFVKHDDQSHGPVRFSAKCTHGSVLRAVVDYVLLALDGSGSVAFGNAPIQSCDWSRVLQETGAARVEEFYRSVCPGILPVRATDLRRHVVRDGALGGLAVQLHSEDESCVEVDLGAESLLDALFTGAETPRLRVLDYDPRKTEQRHGRGKHVYVLHRDILESDVVISVPKLKTHEKVGVTAGIKGCVGAVAHKDCLAHHRRGRPKYGGDEFPDRLGILTPLSALHEFANLQEPGWRKALAHSIDVYSRKVVRRFTRAVGGSWPGNDTCWRMALDLARILACADKKGRMRRELQRRHLVVTDGIVAGENNGPLSPTPVPFGYASFSDNLVAGDYVNCLAMGFDPAKIQLIRGALALGRCGLEGGSAGQWRLRLNGRAVSSDEMRQAFTRRFAPPREWRELLS